MKFDTAVIFIDFFGVIDVMGFLSGCIISPVVGVNKNPNLEKISNKLSNSELCLELPRKSPHVFDLGNTQNS